MPNDYLRYSPIHPPIVIEKSHLTEIQEMQDSAKPVTDACRKADEAWQSVLWGFVGFMINRTIGCLPLLQRVFIHPSHIEQYEERAIALGLGGAGLMVLYAIGGILGLHDWSLGVVSWLGIGLLAVAAVAFALCLAHLAIAARHPEKSTGAGFGLLNIQMV